MDLAPLSKAFTVGAFTVLLTVLSQKKSVSDNILLSKWYILSRNKFLIITKQDLGTSLCLTGCFQNFEMSSPSLLNGSPLQSD